MSQQTSNRKEVRIIQTALLISGVLFLILGLAGVGTFAARAQEAEQSEASEQAQQEEQAEQADQENKADPFSIALQSYAFDSGTSTYTWVLQGTAEEGVSHVVINTCLGNTATSKGGVPEEGTYKDIEYKDADHPDPTTGATGYKWEMTSGDVIVGSTFVLAFLGEHGDAGTASWTVKKGQDQRSGSAGGPVCQQQTAATTTTTTIAVGADRAAAEAARKRAALAATGVDRNSTYMWMAAGLLLLTVAMSLKGFLRETVYERVSKIIRSSGPPR